MCGGGGAANRAADAAAAEARRQAEIERARLAEEARIAKEEADKRYAEEIARQEARFAEEKANAEALRKQIADQEAFRIAEMARIEAERKAEREADLARSEKERADDAAAKEKDRAAAAADAAAKATALGEYNKGRQAAVDNARAQIEGAFGGFNENYFKDFANSYVGHYTPQLEQQFDDAKRATTFGFADRGTIDSTAAARAFGRLTQTKATEQANIAQRAQSSANDLRSTIDKQKADALNAVFGAVNAAPVITADTVGGANDSLSALSSALTAPVSLASRSAGSISSPAFSNLDSVFSTPTKRAAPRTTFGGGGPGGSTSSGSSGRLVA